MASSIAFLNPLRRGFHAEICFLIGRRAIESSGQHGYSFPTQVNGMALQSAANFDKPFVFQQVDLER